jgi:hypothetical protein
MLARSGQWWNIGQLREGDRLAGSLEAQSGRTESSTERDSSGWERREEIQVNVRVTAATIRGLTAARRATSRGASARSARWLDSKKVTVENAVPARAGRVFGPSGTVARLRIPRSTLESKVRAVKNQGSPSFVGSEGFLTWRCLGFHRWPHLAGLASAYARVNSVPFDLER